MVELFANSGEPDQTPHSAASYLYLCHKWNGLLTTLLGVSRIQWVKVVLILSDVMPEFVKTYTSGNSAVHIRKSVVWAVALNMSVENHLVYNLA